MAFDPLFKMTIQSAGGAYWFATLGEDAVWVVDKQTDLRYIEVLPDGWQDTAIVWERDMSYKGIFRNGTEEGGSYKFTMDARAIIQNIRSNEGIKGSATLTIYILTFDDVTGITYPIFYKCQLDFKTYHDYRQSQTLTIEMLDSGLIRDFYAYGNTKFNIPIWTASGGGWITDANWIIHDGIKVLYNSRFTSGAAIDSGLALLIPGWYQGGHDGTSTHGNHTILSMQPYSFTQNNGTTTYIGNDILQPILTEGEQLEFLQETSFQNSESYTKNRFCMKTSVNAAMTIKVSGQFDGTVTYDHDGVHDRILSFVIFEIKPNNEPDELAGNYTVFARPLDISMPVTGVYTPPDAGMFSGEVAATLSPGHVYVFGILFDSNFSPGLNFSNLCSVHLIDLRLEFTSQYNSGTAAPVEAAKFPPSVFAAYPIYKLWEKVIPYLATKTTDAYGFPIPVATDYEGVSAFLSDAAVLVADCCPKQLMFTSAYCMHDLEGQSYISISPNEIFDFCAKQFGCGITPEYDVDGVAIKLRIENLSNFFPDATDPANMMFDLGFDVFDIEILQGGADIGLGANLKLGYAKADTNADFGVISFNTELYFNTPVSEVPGVMDFEDSDILTDENPIEKIRAQKISQPVGASYNPASPSGDNQTIALYVLPATTQVLPDTGGNESYPNLIAYDPVNTPLTVSAFQLTQRNGVNLPAAQSTDPTAATNPFIEGLYYPDTAINVEISPSRALQRDLGALLHSLFDNMDSDVLTFRNTSVMQYNNQALALSGISSNLRVGASATPVTEMSDKAIVDLPPQLFKPIPISVKSTSKRIMYTEMQTNPNRYIQFSEELPGYGTMVYKMYLTKVKQIPTMQDNVVTTFEGWATVDMVI